jgi:hypothetical protein
VSLQLGFRDVKESLPSRLKAAPSARNCVRIPLRAESAAVSILKNHTGIASLPRLIRASGNDRGRGLALTGSKEVHNNEEIVSKLAEPSMI